MKPKTLLELKSAGYTFVNVGTCIGCGARIEWWITPLENKMPMSVLDDDKRETHFASCPKAKEFRRSNKRKG